MASHGGHDRLAERGALPLSADQVDAAWHKAQCRRGGITTYDSGGNWTGWKSSSRLQTGVFLEVAEVLVCRLALAEHRDVRGGHPQSEREHDPLAAGTAVTANDHVAIGSELARGVPGA